MATLTANRPSSSQPVTATKLKDAGVDEIVQALNILLADLFGVLIVAVVVAVAWFVPVVGTILDRRRLLAASSASALIIVIFLYLGLRPLFGVHHATLPSPDGAIAALQKQLDALAAQTLGPVIALVDGGLTQVAQIRASIDQRRCVDGQLRHFAIAG